MILVTVPGAHLRKQAREDDNSNGHGGSASPCFEAKRAARAGGPCWKARARVRITPGCADRWRDVARPVVPPGAVVAGFWPLAGEIDMRLRC